MEDMLQVGVISTTHGIKGEVKIFPTTDNPERFKELKSVFLETKQGMKTLEITGVKFFKKFVILKFKEFDNINDVEKYKGCALFVARENAVKLEKDEYFIVDLIGLKVRDEEKNLTGTLIDVIETGANDVYVVELEDGREVLLPAIKQCILSVDIEKQLILVDIMDGLLS